ncbi:uncharacterized protein LOC118646461 [Monomorium pharaonis]|uniref:uncharacterized protein LOC118646461 n=1 Tax=Monomorium pharaonis TaxID=307658 RepID=UPI0017463575|nr:uncharacterized protein LOC118646461 [Monomorium pharaonis]
MSATTHATKKMYFKFWKLFQRYKFDFTKAFTKKNLKNFDASSLPPCQRELRQQLLSCKYITNIWQNANKKKPSDLDPEAFGWIAANQFTRYEFKWFDGKQLPKIVKDVIMDKDDSEGTALNIDKFN